jgi:hypothetical protein
MAAFCGTALADGVGVQTRHLKAKDKTALKAEVAARAQNATVFQGGVAPKLAIEADQMKRPRGQHHAAPARPGQGRALPHARDAGVRRPDPRKDERQH